MSGFVNSQDIQKFCALNILKSTSSTSPGSAFEPVMWRRAMADQEAAVPLAGDEVGWPWKLGIGC